MWTLTVTDGFGRTVQVVRCASKREANSKAQAIENEGLNVEGTFSRARKSRPVDREAAILAGMEGGCEAYNAAMGYDVDFGDNYHGGWQSWED